MVRRYVMSLTYKPKIEGVFNGTIRQTIRKTNKFKVGDVITFHTWEGKPYRSKWGKRLEVTLHEVFSLWCWSYGVVNEHYFMCTWEAPGMKKLAEDDGISSPSGERLKEVLKELNGIDWQGEYQVLRW